MSRRKMGLLLAAAAAYGVYQYSKLTPEQRKGLLAKGKDFLNNNLGSLTDLWSKARATTSQTGY